MGRELGPDTIPGETGVVPVAVSFTKGCYTGQELVARIDSRGGNVPRHLCRLRSTETIAVGEPIVVDGKEVGRVTERDRTTSRSATSPVRSSRPRLPPPAPSP